mmetsp:Transcript_73429/g.215338  ORF Transcript_73429/g.215338 Transcript_73429/m.215338 type:complete len:227 (-) Transcript_73429:65-745(-)
MLGDVVQQVGLVVVHLVDRRLEVLPRAGGILVRSIRGALSPRHRPDDAEVVREVGNLQQVEHRDDAASVLVLGQHREGPGPALAVLREAREELPDLAQAAPLHPGGLEVHLPRPVALVPLVGARGRHEGDQRERLVQVEHDQLHRAAPVVLAGAPLGAPEPEDRVPARAREAAPGIPCPAVRLGQAWRDGGRRRAAALRLADHAKAASLAPALGALAHVRFPRTSL